MSSRTRGNLHYGGPNGEAFTGDEKSYKFLKIFKKNEHSIIIGFHESGSKKASESLLSEKEYDKNIQLVREILNGKFKKVKDLLRLQMNIFSKTKS